MQLKATCVTGGYAGVFLKQDPKADTAADRVELQNRRQAFIWLKVLVNMKLWTSMTDCEKTIIDYENCDEYNRRPDNEQ